ncbi:MAG: retropepsin-like aspartic protease [Planctomycetota bacterium]
MFRATIAALIASTLSTSPVTVSGQDVPLGGFIPFVGIGMTNEFKTLDEIDLGGIPFIADPSFAPGAPLLGQGGTPFFDLALLDTGAATHIITQEAFDGFDIVGNGMRGTNIQPIGGATGIIDLEINDAAGIYTTGLGDRTAAGTTLDLDTSTLRGQTSIATLTAPDEWTLPNILGLPMAAQHLIAIHNSDPQIFQHQGRTVRTPQVEFRDLGSGNDGIVRRAPLNLRPGIGFVQGPQYVFNLDVGDILGGSGGIAIHNNPASPSVIIDSNGNGAGLFIDIDFENEGHTMDDVELLFDTGADLTVVSEIMAARLGFDPVLDKADFVLEVEGSGGVSAGIPGFYIDELNIDTVGGSFTMQNVPVAVLDVTNPNDPGNVIDGILGMHLFTGRDLVIDANASVGQGGTGPSLYISDPVTETRNWASNAASANWATATSWSAPGTPTEMWVTNVANPSGNPQVASVTADSTVFQLIVSGTSTNAMTIEVASGATLTTFGETRIEAGGRIEISDGAKVDAQFINIEGGTLTGSGDIFVGTGPITGQVRNLTGRVEPGDGIGKLSIVGDLSNLEDGTVAFDLGGLTPESQYDQIELERFAFLAGILEVSLVDDFMPSVGDMFTIIEATEGVEGEFDQLMLPDGFLWSVDYLPNSVVLEVTGLGSVAGDFDSDGDVDADDLAMMRDGYTSGAYGGASFLEWQRNVNGAGGVAASTTVPEPTSMLMGCLLTLGWVTVRVKSRRVRL